MPVGLHLPPSAASPRVQDGRDEYPRPQTPPGLSVPVLTVLCRAPAAAGGPCPACPGSAALPVVGATPGQSHLMEGAGIQHPAEREVGHPLEIPGKGREISAPAPRPRRGGVWLCSCRGFGLSQDFHRTSFTPQHQNFSQVVKQEGFGSAATADL